jgi:predicted phosphohydrolase
MRIVAVADTHTEQRHLGAIPDGDVFVHAGDLCLRGKLEELQPAVEWLRSLPHRHKVLVAGNHDWSFVREREVALAMLGDIVYLEDSGTTINGVRFWGSPWQPEFRNWAFNLPRGEPLAAKWARIPTPTDVLITHGPPQGIGDWVFWSSSRQGCADLLARVQEVKPLFHLFGHIHEDGGFWQQEGTSFANVTAWECDRGVSVIDVHVESRVVTPVLIPPARKAIERKPDA